LLFGVPNAANYTQGAVFKQRKIAPCIKNTRLVFFGYMIKEQALKQKKMTIKYKHQPDM